MILSIDQSTAATKALLWGMDGTLLARTDVPHRQITNKMGWVEHDPMEIYENTLEAVRRVIAGRSAGEIAVIGLCNQRETAVCWDMRTGLPLYNAVVWQCGRAADVVQEIREAGLEAEVWQRTGLLLSPYFSAAKWGWMSRHSPEVAQAKGRGTLCCGTVDSWLLFKLTGVFKTDYTNASRTQLMDLHTLMWDAELVEAFGVGCLPEIVMSDSLFGLTRLDGILPRLVPIHCVMGDSHAALFGNQCWEPFTAKATYGTGSSVMVNAGTVCPTPGAGIAASVAWGIGGQIEYVLEGNINNTGSVIKWITEGIGLLPDVKCAGTLSTSVEDTGGVYLVPAFTGLGAPYYNSDARAAFLGMNSGTRKAHLVRAAEEAIAYQIRDVVEAVGESSPLSLLRVDGGPTRDEFLMQFQADILGIPLEVNRTEELSSMGVAYCAAIGAGIADRESIFAGQQRRVVMPQMGEEQREALYTGWKNAVGIINRRAER